MGAGRTATARAIARVVASAVILLIVATSGGLAQIKRDSTQRGDTLRNRGVTPRDSAARRDSTGRLRAPGDTTHKELIHWEPPVSVMTELMSRRGYQTTRYQGDTVVFRDTTKTINLLGRPSGVERDQT